MQNDGGPVFPVTEEQEQQGWDGISLRDYFAAKALQAIIIAHEDSTAMSADSAEAYAYADAMLKARHGK